MGNINETIIEAQVIEALRTCFDPEIQVNIYEMGLIYDTKIGRAKWRFWKARTGGMKIV